MLDYPSIELLRVENSHQYGVFGLLLINKGVFCATLEPPDYANTPFFSCIPSGQYLCSRTTSATYGGVFEVRHVPNRDYIYFHAGNMVDDTEGCILLGEHHGKLFGNRAVLNSGKTYNRFMSILKSVHTFKLTIREVY